MDGITILYTYTYSSDAVGKIIALLFCLCVFIFSMIFAIKWLKDNEREKSSIARIIALASLLACIFIFNIKLNFHERYEVVIDDSVSFSEFSEKYEIIKVRGKIYTIEERVD